MFEYNPLHCLPLAEDLPDSDDTPEELATDIEQRAQKLAEKLRQLGINPDEL